MSQSSIIAGALLAAFIFWLAVNDRLQAYTAVLWGPTAAPKPNDKSGGVGAFAPGASGGGGGGPLGGISRILPGGGGGISGILEAAPPLLEAAPSAVASIPFIP